ncbi:nitrite reductase [Sulfurifustis variabilis]|uniref:Nitrite reductase n=1 Tax=Sulfurifustis variabilis TaxID=1675686 RepID=A0A1B4VFE8_9GAMM|nr:FAD-dependent oxidoreductase [Sulfurifustis variabilis]BAU49457.1 nitrite reductase [Sulfurifustis variabilis]
MPALPRPAEPAPTAAGPAPIVIVGTGPVGMRVAAELLRRDPYCPIVLYGDEPWEPYQRVRLSALLMGEIGWSGVANPLALPGDHRVVQRHHCPVLAIDRERRRVRDAAGREQAYRALVLATGSRPHVPRIAGIERAGVYTFRDMSDVQRLMARSVRTRTTVVLGGGLLGIEAARALRRRRTDVVVVQHAGRLMNRHLDPPAAALLKRHVEGLGIRVVLADGVRDVLGGRAVEGVRLLSGSELACDTLVLATGIRPNIELALAAGLSVGRGIRVDDAMRTIDPAIYAVGECAEHRGQVIGLVAPGLEQAAVAAHRILGADARFEARMSPAQLKVVGLPVFSMGEVGDDENPSAHRAVVHARPGAGVHRRLVLARNRIVGAVAVGDWSELPRLQEAITHRRRLGPMQLWRFRREGVLWGDGNADAVADWPANATVCNCAGVTRAALTSAIARGCRTVEQLGASTSAGTVCGSCRPLLARLLGAQAPATPRAGTRAMAAVAASTLLLLALFIWPGPLPHDATVQGGWKPEVLWTDAVWKQASGYTLLAIAAGAIPLSLRKRWARLRVGDYGGWRLAHAGLGVAALVVVALHTGLHAGSHLNFWLLLCFLALTKLGSLAAAAVALEGVPSRWSRRARSVSTLLHIVCTWPLPPLLAFHVLSVYYF